MNTQTLPIGKLLETIGKCMKAGINLVIYGPPGLGKTQIAKQAAAHFDRIYAEMLLAGRDIGDVFMPYVDPDQRRLTFHYNPAIPLLQHSHFDKPTLLNIDEFSGANRLMQNVLLKVLDEHKVGEASLREDVWLMATGNRASDLAHTEQISSALANRATLITVEPDLQAFLQYGVTNGFHPITLAWVRFDEENLFSFDEEAFLAGDFAFPSPRANERLSKLMFIRDQDGMDDDIFRNLACGTIGQSRGVKFTGFVKIANDMPNIDDLLQGVHQPMPKDPAVLYATLTAIVQKTTRPSLQHAVDYIGRMAPEWGEMFVTYFTQSKPNLVNNPVWGKFIAQTANASR